MLTNMANDEIASLFFFLGTVPLLKNVLYHFDDITEFTESDTAAKSGPCFTDSLIGTRPIPATPSILDFETLRSHTNRVFPQRSQQW